MDASHIPFRILWYVLSNKQQTADVYLYWRWWDIPKSTTMLPKNAQIPYRETYFLVECCMKIKIIIPKDSCLSFSAFQPRYLHFYVSPCDFSLPISFNFFASYVHADKYSYFTTNNYIMNMLRTIKKKVSECTMTKQPKGLNQAKKKKLISQQPTDFHTHIHTYTRRHFRGERKPRHGMNPKIEIHNISHFLFRLTKS